jgi:hypothetical protein
MDCREAQLAGPAIRESVSLARRADDDMAALDHDRAIADLERCLTGLDDEDLGVRVPVQLRTDTRRGMHQDDRKRDFGVFGPDELVRMV